MAVAGSGLSYFNADTPDFVLRSLFSKYDQDGNGTLSRDEIKTMLQDDMGMTQQQASDYFFVVDKDGSGVVTFDEFRRWLHSEEKFRNVNDKSRYNRLTKAVSLFKQYDADGSGTLEREEFKKLFRATGGKRNKVDKALAELDRDGNGKISFNEFMRWLRWLPAEDFD